MFDSLLINWIQRCRFLLSQMLHEHHDQHKQHDHEHQPGVTGGKQNMTTTKKDQTILIPLVHWPKCIYGPLHHLYIRTISQLICVKLVLWPVFYLSSHRWQQDALLPLSGPLHILGNESHSVHLPVIWDSFNQEDSLMWSPPGFGGAFATETDHLREWKTGANPTCRWMWADVV